MTGVVALRADGRVATHCCGRHRPAPGEGSRCVCCPECVTNAVLSGYDAEVLRVAARWERADAVPHLLRLRSGYRRVEHALAVQAMWDAVRHGEPLFTDGGFPPVQGRLT